MNEKIKYSLKTLIGLVWIIGISLLYWNYLDIIIYLIDNLIMQITVLILLIILFVYLIMILPKKVLG